ncbi:DUF4062 domain-containing protein [Nannocystis sp.]|uniref:DUF4062 domain-containing protein n=1 Tax=Nannocystis sp. TaxID=1962667 RepID=UPI0025EA5094|nr:DUF4062 domain-containing protein [Nannocystis sp.]MBK7828419.1 DUF4062 domain-containing protein [Nannocystis sp.]
MYQVFVSSTYVDLHPERDAVSWAILKTRNTPAGMEAFPATDDRGWKTIQKTIDESDFYVLILGHRYGSTESTSGLSWTQKEYRYAKSKSIPVLAFLRELSATPGTQVDADRSKIDAFRAEVKDSHKIVMWHHLADLAASVSQALPLAIQDYIDDEIPRPGWIRGSASALKVVDELAALSEENRTFAGGWKN